ncbi:hypothetical protein [uncultured Eubacterium sp.]|uniref:hypothetical protein n=1 Tax=uncultured Eubacterium sp. TaxID=165185 RepID=UPI002620171E|nr:hypothetical protein [uncultured Eubacterium sp.]
MALPWAIGIAPRPEVCQNIEAAGAPSCVYRGVPKGCAYSSRWIGENRKKTQRRYRPALPKVSRWQTASSQ